METVKTGCIYHIPMSCQPNSFVGVVPTKPATDPHTYYCLPVYSSPTKIATRQTGLGYTLPKDSEQWVVAEAWLIKHNPQLSIVREKSKMLATHKPTKKVTPKERFERQLKEQIQRSKARPYHDGKTRKVPAVDRPWWMDYYGYEDGDLFDHAYQGGLCTPK